MKNRTTVYLGEMMASGTKAMEEAREKACEFQKKTKEKVLFGTINNWKEKIFQAYVELER